MTIQDIINWFGTNSTLVLIYFGAILLLSLLGLLLVKPKNYKTAVKYFYSLMVYAVCIPGILSFLLLLYNLFFLKANLLQLDIMTTFLPLGATIISLVIINKTVPMSLIPGFGRLSGLFLVIMISFFMTYFIQKMFFGVFFVGRAQYLILFFLALLLLMRFAWKKVVS